jgi:hypothetical protein
VYASLTLYVGCPQAASGPGGLGIFRIGSGGSVSPVPVPGSKGSYNFVQGQTAAGLLLVLARTSCPGTSSLLLLNPVTGAVQVLQPGLVGQAGVVVAVPFGG